jgi:hypothetical protein
VKECLEGSRQLLGAHIVCDLRCHFVLTFDDEAYDAPLGIEDAIDRSIACLNKGNER